MDLSDYTRCPFIWCIRQIIFHAQCNWALLLSIVIVILTVLYFLFMGQSSQDR
jgi:heme/copper-type cytochrome/quinol oxidase subunit 4